VVQIHLWAPDESIGEYAMINMGISQEISLACVRAGNMNRKKMLEFIDNYGKGKDETIYVKEFLQRKLKEEVVDELIG
jgi:hypothetical protein